MNKPILKSKQRDILAHIFLYFGLGVGALGIFLSRFDSIRQFLVILLLVVFYLIWGFVYHHLKRDATRNLMVEYLIIALISLLAAYFVLVI